MSNIKVVQGEYVQHKFSFNFFDIFTVQWEAKQLKHSQRF